MLKSYGGYFKGTFAPDSSLTFSETMIHLELAKCAWIVQMRMDAARWTNQLQTHTRGQYEKANICGCLMESHHQELLPEFTSHRSQS